MSATLPFAEAEITDTIAARFQRVVACLPEQLAVLADDGTFSYGAINNIAERIAQAIGSQQPPNSGPLAILLPQSAQTLATLLGCLKAGYSFLVLPPTFPLPRLRAIWADARSPLLLTESHHWQQALAITTRPAQCLNLEQLAASKPASAGNAVPTTSTTSELAALFYTSGTTGEPKGVMWLQSLVLHTARQNQILYGLTPQDRIAILTSFGFGAAMTLAFAALLNGATVCLMNQPLSAPAALLRQLQQQAATILGLPPVGLFRQMMDTLERGPTIHGGLGEGLGGRPDGVLPALRLVLLGGQPLRRQDVTRFYHCFGEPVMLRYRLAGSETMLMCDLPITPQTVYPGDDLPVGYAAPDKEILLLDEDRQPVKLGEIGEIIVRSRYLAAGYWQAPTLTAATFLVDPTDADRWLSFTGDMGRMIPDGMLFHLGRKDNMVKVRGYRVQLEAVEAALNRLSAIDEAVVVAHATRNGEQQLLAYYTSQANPPPTTTALRQALLAHLPEFMLPTRFIALASLPRNTTGKLDRAALPPPGAERPTISTPFVAPCSEQEQQIADLWAELLGIDKIGIDDNFFELGGDSLLAMRTLLNVEKAGIPIKSTAFFPQPTVKTLAGSDAVTPLAVASLPTAKRARVAGRAKYSIPVLRSAAANRFARLMAQGPSGQKQHMSYGFGVRIQRALVAQSWVREKLYAQQISLVRQRHAEIGDQTRLDESITVSLLAKTWVRWRSQALTTPAVVGKWLILSGQLEPLLTMSHPMSGVVIAVPHVGRMIDPLLQIVQWTGRETAKVVNVEHFTNGQLRSVSLAQQLQGRSAQLWNAQQVLQRKGAVLIAADGLQGSRSINTPLWGRRRPFQHGAAELAISTRSAFTPVYVTFDVQGRIYAEASAPLPIAASSPEHQISELTEHYAVGYVERWPHFYASLRWHLLAYTLALPQV